MVFFSRKGELLAISQRSEDYVPGDLVTWDLGGGVPHIGIVFYLWVGMFAVFAHGGCFGEEGHCEVRPPVSPFDRRQPHALVPIARYLTVTDAIRDLIGRDERSVTVTAVPVVRPSALATADQAADVLTVGQVALHTFE